MLSRRAWMAGAALASQARAQEIVRLPRKVRLAIIGLEGHTGEILDPMDRLPDVDLVVANAVLPRRFAAGDVAKLQAASNGGGPAAAAVAHAGRVRAQQGQLQRLRRGARGPVVTLPWMLDVEPDELADRLITETGAARRAPRRPGPVDVPSG